MDKLFWARDQKEVAKWQQFDKGMRMYCAKMMWVQFFKSFEWVTILLDFSY